MEKKKRSRWAVAALAALPVLVLIGLIVVIALRFTVAAPFKVPSSSMLPTLPPDSHVFVDKADWDTPRGRVIAFRYPENPDQDFIKRIIALPGETISVKGGEVRIDGRAIPRCRVGEWSYDDPGGAIALHKGELWLESIGRVRWLVFHDAAMSAGGDEGPWHVAQGEVFVLGDNRENSHDSRMWFGGKGGGVPKTLLVGAVRNLDRVELPKGAESLKAAFDACNETLNAATF